MAIDTTQRGESREFEIQIVQSDGTTPEDLTAVINYIAVVHNQDGRELTKFTKLAITGETFELLEASDEVNGKFIIRLQASKTVDAEVGQLFVTTKLQKTNTDFENDRFSAVSDPPEKLTLLEDNPTRPYPSL